jgi:hypothetical protein
VLSIVFFIMVVLSMYEAQACLVLFVYSHIDVRMYIIPKFAF